MNYKTESITARAEESDLWPVASNQQGEVLPYLLERYLLLENWKYRDRLMSGEEHKTKVEDIQYLHLLLAEATTVLLSQEERIRRLEAGQSVVPLMDTTSNLERKMSLICAICGDTYAEHFGEACPVITAHDTQKFKAK